MKTNFILLSIFLAFFIETQSQVINGAVADSLYGKIYRINLSDTNSIKPNISGENVVWDFSNAVSNGIDSVKVINPINTPYISSFTESNLCFSTSGKFYYYSLDNSKFNFDGEFDGTNLFLGDGMNPELLMDFPVTSESRHRDEFTSSYNFGGYIDYFRKGNATIEVDGTGTLILPDSTIENVVRIHIQETFYDSIIDFGMNMDYTTDSYYWYQEGDFLPLVSYSKFTNVLTGSSTYTVYYQHNPIVNSVDEFLLSDKNKLSVYPNPSNGFVNIKIDAKLTQKKLEITLVSIDGRILAKQKEQFSENGTYFLDYSNMAKGIYYIVVKTENINLSRKIIIE